MEQGCSEKIPLCICRSPEQGGVWPPVRKSSLWQLRWTLRLYFWCTCRSSDGATENRDKAGHRGSEEKDQNRSKIGKQQRQIADKQQQVPETVLAERDVSQSQCGGLGVWKLLGTATGAPLKAGNGEGGGAGSVSEEGGRVPSPGPSVPSSCSCPEVWPG